METIKNICRICVWLVVISPCIIYGQSDTLNRTDKFGKKYGAWEKYEKGKLLWKATFYNGEPVGEFIHFYPDKKIKDKLYYHPNSPKVTAETYHPNGKKASEGIFINKNKDGKWLYYNSSEKLVAEESYLSGKKQGVFKLYSPEDGTLLEEESWKNGILNGEHIEYFTTGSIRLKWHHKDGKIDGAFESYYLDGKVWNKGQYIAGLRNGTWTCYDREGNEMKIEEITRERVTRTVLGFKAPGQWLKLDATTIAYFFQKPGNNICIQLWNGKKIMLDEENSLVEISNTAGVGLFIFVNEGILSSYESIRKITETGENEATVTLKPQPSFEVYTYDDYYKILKALMNPEPPKQDE